MSDLADRIRQSVANRKAITDRYGMMPLSILKLSRGALSRQMFLYQHDVPARNMAKQERNKRKQEKLAAVGYRHARSSPSQRGAGRGSLGATIMSPELVDFFIKYYADDGQTYLDPFMGQGVQMQVAHLHHMPYYGYDISQEFFEYTAAVQRKIDDNTSALCVYCADSRTPDLIPDGIGDFCFTSPPYWDIEYYGTEPEQLGTGHTYDDFIEGMQQVAAAWLPKFKPGAWVVINVNDFRKDKRFYAYHADTISLFVRAGYELHDLWVIEGLVGGLPKAFAVDFNRKRIAPKVHEYALVFKVSR